MKLRNAKHLRAFENQVDPGTPPPPAPPAEKTFKQADVDKIIQDRLAAATAKANKDQASLLERIKSLETDSTRKAELEQQIEELSKQNLTKEQLAEQERKKERAAWEGKLKETESKAVHWQDKYTSERIVRDITDAAASKEADAYNPTQIVELLRPRARMVERLDKETGKPTGLFETRVKLSGSKDGQPVELDLTAGEAIKVMKEDAERFGNLFKANVSGGLGSTSPRQNGKSTDISKMSQDEINKRYREGGINALIG